MPYTPSMKAGPPVGQVQVDARAGCAHGIPPVQLPVGSVLLADDGTALLVRHDGGLDPWPPFGWKSIASDPVATRSRKECHG